MGDGERIKVLFVDDDVSILNSLRRVLKRESLDVLTAESGARALEVLAKEKVDVIVSDEKMPGMTGSELLAEVRNRFPAVCCRVMLTGHADLAIAVQAINEGRIHRFLLKPIKPTELVDVIHDAINECRQTERLLEFSQQAGGVCSYEFLEEADGRQTLRWSENARSLLQLPSGTPLDSLDILAQRLHPDDRREFADFFRATVEPASCRSIEYRIVLPDESERWISQTCDLSVSPGSGRRRYLTILKDVTEIRKQHDRLEYQAYHDVLTGLGNRALLLSTLKEDLALERQSGCLALFFIDIDEFKIINDSMGHTFGDLLLKSFARRLQEFVGDEGMAARLGGDEFALLLHVDGGQAALACTGRIREALARPFIIDDYELHITASIGIALAEGGEPTELDLLRDADTAMYEAKEGGRGSARLFDSSMRERASERFMIVSDMHKALERDEFFLVFQPIVSLETMKLAGFEALIRWQHPELGLVMPERFIPQAETSAIISRIGLQVMRMACAQARKLAESRPENPPFMSFNVAVRQLWETDFVEHLTSVIEENTLDPGQIKVEITESGLMDDVRTSVRVMDRLKGLGVKLQIDDFGTGYSSMRYLQRIPADNLKVDRSFVSGMELDPENQAIVRTTIDLAHNLDLRTVAEGVERREQLVLLRELGCEFGQGFLFDKPLPAEETLTRDDYSHLLEDRE